MTSVMHLKSGRSTGNDAVRSYLEGDGCSTGPTLNFDTGRITLRWILCD
jgi:hypothetical protein